MAPPHGLCSEPMTRALGAVGFDALTRDPPAAVDRDATGRSACWPAGAPADFVARMPSGTAYSARIKPQLTSDCERSSTIRSSSTDITRMSQTALTPLAETAAVDRRSWATSGGARSATSSPATSNSEPKATACTCGRSRGGSCLPSGRTCPASPWRHRLIHSTTPRSPASPSGAPGMPRSPGTPVPFGRVVALDPGDAPHLEIQLHGAADVEPRLVPAPVWRPWPKLRRAVTELRDRAIAQRKVPAEATSSPKTAAT